MGRPASGPPGILSRHGTTARTRCHAPTCVRSVIMTWQPLTASNGGDSSIRSRRPTLVGGLCLSSNGYGGWSAVLLPV